MDWFKGQFTGNKLVFTIKLVGVSCKFSHHPVLWMLKYVEYVFSDGKLVDLVSNRSKI
jgi:hypothetical protein